MFRRKLRRENLLDFENILDDLVKQFETKKKRFTGNESIRFDVPGLKEDLTMDRGFRNGKLLVSSYVLSYSLCVYGHA